ncbi:MAG: hypothetical protein JXB26_19640 [Candidatus Aminicenantes bacterium]|nr:hypothetical protein [Candidatus Aminicenantes bacterium]
MAEEKKERQTGQENGEIRIDYDNIDVEDIMRQIRERIAARPVKPVPEKVPFDSRDAAFFPPDYEEEAGPAGIKGRLKNLILRIMRPLSPLIKLLILPVHEEVRRTVINLDQTNRRLDYINARIEDDLNRLRAELDHVNQVTNERLDMALDDIVRIKEYSKLLHNLSHNLVVELTKLKIEEEHLRSASRILDKNFAMLGKRERALEKEVFK